jgi:hypothetical protein
MKAALFALLLSTTAALAGGTITIKNTPLKKDEILKTEPAVPNLAATCKARGHHMKVDELKDMMELIARKYPNSAVIEHMDDRLLQALAVAMGKTDEVKVDDILIWIDKENDQNLVEFFYQGCSASKVFILTNDDFTSLMGKVTDSLRGT